MIKLIHCDNCDKTQLGVTIKFTQEISRCDQHHIHTKDWNFYFCNINCMMTWLNNNDIAVKGFPCRDCRSTGFAYGFKQNGVCLTCNGKTRVFDTKMPQ